MSASFVGSLVASALMCAVLAMHVEVQRPPPDLDVRGESDEAEMRSAWAAEVMLEVHHEPCDVELLERRLAALKPGGDPSQRSRLLVAVRRCGGRWGEDPQCARGPDGGGCLRF